MKDEKPLWTDRYYKYCPKCDAAYPRGVVSDYPVTCECGEKFTVPKTGTLAEAK